MPPVYPKPSPAAVDVDSSKKGKVLPPVRRGRSATAVDVNSSKKRKVQSKAQPESKSDVESESNSSSESDSDPDEEVLPEDLLVHGVSVFDFECVRDASRSRVSDRTRTQYDDFIGLMAAFAMRSESHKSLVIQKEGRLTFQPPLPMNFVHSYLSHVEDKRVSWRGNVNGYKKPVSPSYYKAVICSIKDLYVCEQIMMQDEMSLFLFSKRAKFNRQIAEMRSFGTYPSAPTRYITSEGFAHVAKTVAKSSASGFSGWAVQAFAALWAYILLLWNLMARCDRVARLRWSDLGWYKDAMTAYLCKSKCDQAGINAFHKKLYFNDAIPEVCPVTALAVLFFSREEDSLRSDFVFPRSDTRRNGARFLSKIIKKHFTTEAHSTLFGCDPLSISWHFFKRGAFTFLAGLADGCSYIATKLRADQKVTDVSRVYTFFGQGQDGVIGRLLSLLPYGEPEFISCAPVLCAGITVVWPELVPDWDNLDGHFKFVVVPRLLACLVYRYEWLKQNLAHDHPLWHSHLEVSGKLLDLRQKVQLEQRALSGLTGVTLEMKNAIRLHAISTFDARVQVPSSNAIASETQPEVRGVSKTPRERDDLRLRLMLPLLSNKRIVPHLTCRQAWRAYFITTDSLPFPLRYMQGKLTLGSDITALSRMKTCMEAISKGIHPRDILEHPEATFLCGFAHMQKSLEDVGTLIYSSMCCSTIEKKLRAAKLRGWSSTAASFIPGDAVSRPLGHEAADAQLRLVELRARAVKSVCSACQGVCLHCTHCDRCATRIGAVAARKDTLTTSAHATKALHAASSAAATSSPSPPPLHVIQSTATAQEAAQLRMAEAERAEKRLAEAGKQQKSSKAKVRCLRCETVYCDKSAYNRHLRSHHTCATHPLFEHTR